MKDLFWLGDTIWMVKLDDPDPTITVINPSGPTVKITITAAKMNEIDAAIEALVDIKTLLVEQSSRF